MNPTWVDEVLMHNKLASVSIEKMRRHREKASSKVLELVLCVCVCDRVVETKTKNKNNNKSAEERNTLRISEAEALRKRNPANVNCVPIREKRNRDEM